MNSIDDEKKGNGFGEKLFFSVPREQTQNFIDEVSKAGLIVRYDKKSQLWSSSAVNVNVDDPIIKKYLSKEDAYVAPDKVDQALEYIASNIDQNHLPRNSSNSLEDPKSFEIGPNMDIVSNRWEQERQDNINELISEETIKNYAFVTAAKADGNMFLARYGMDGFRVQSGDEEKVGHEIRMAKDYELAHMYSINSDRYYSLKSGGDSIINLEALKHGSNLIGSEVKRRSLEKSNILESERRSPALSRYAERGFMLAGEGKPRHELQLKEIEAAGERDLKETADVTKEVYRKLHKEELLARFSSIFLESGRRDEFLKSVTSFSKPEDLALKPDDKNNDGFSVYEVMSNSTSQEDRITARNKLLNIYMAMDFSDQKRFSGFDAENVERTNAMNALKRGFSALDAEYQKRTGKPLGRIVSDVNKRSFDNSLIGVRVQEEKADKEKKPSDKQSAMSSVLKRRAVHAMGMEM